MVTNSKVKFDLELLQLWNKNAIRNGSIDYGLKKGHKEGYKEGREEERAKQKAIALQEKTESIKSFLGLGSVAIADIARSFKVSEEFVEKIKAEMDIRLSY